MDPKTLKRDAAVIHKALKKLPDGSIVALKECKIYIPKRYEESNLASIATEVVVLGIFAIMVDDKFYGVSNVVARMRIEPTTINSIKIDGEDFYEFGFESGATVFNSVDLVQENTLPYYVYNEFIAKGKVPWFMDYNDMGKIFESTAKHAGVRLGNNHAIIEMIISTLGRTPDDLTKYYRHTAEQSKGVTFIPFRSVTYGATNTTSKILGAYFDDGLDSALTNPSTQVENVERLLRL